jgi:2-haloacid dehalogenase
MAASSIIHGHRQPAPETIPMPRRILVFDVNETLLDLADLDPVFAQLFGDKSARKSWFASLLHWSTVTTLTGTYQDFGALANACLDELAGKLDLSLSASDKQRVFDAIANLPLHAEVPGALARLESAGFTLVALTNSAQATVDEQFAQTGLTPLFSQVLSVQRAGVFKPHPQAYALAAQAMDCPLESLRLIAAHDWDVTGAIRAGCAAAFVARNGARLNPAGEIPDIVAPDLDAVAQQVVAVDG